MARCKDCIHEIVCSAIIEKGLPWNDGEYPAEAFCMAFRNKADVEPKNEVERLIKLLDDKCDRCIDRERKKVAREIFEEIEKLEQGRRYAGKNVFMLIPVKKFAELKKKYTEEKK